MEQHRISQDDTHALSLPLAAGFAAAIVSTSFHLRHLRDGWGNDLMGILLAFMPLAPAMVLHGLVQMASNGWQAWQWRAHIDWRIVAHYAAGAVVATAGVSAIALMANKAIALIIVSVSPLLGRLLLPGGLRPAFGRPSHSHGTRGVLCTVLRLLAEGVSGPYPRRVLRTLAAQWPRQLIAARPPCKCSGIFEGAWLGTCSPVARPYRRSPSSWPYRFASPGGYLARFVRQDHQRDAIPPCWSRYVIGAVSAVYLIEGVVLL